MIHAKQNTVVLGLGRSGYAAAVLLAEEGACVTVCESSDGAASREKAATLEALGVRVLFGDEAEADSSSYDLCVLSPGIDPAVPLVRNVLDKRIPVIGELELAFEECLCPVVAITGTNGKTTTTELTTAMLQGAGLRAMASGNIGIPFAEAVSQSGELDVMVLEVSSFQLETIRSFRPHVAAWLNFSPNHLDRYPDVAAYRAAKLRIFENQGGQDFAVLNAHESLPELPSRRIGFSATQDHEDFTLEGSVITFRSQPVLDQSSTRLPGIHNAENLMAALGIGVVLGVDLDKLAQSVGTYSPPPHRCEFVRDLEGVRWVNDSKSTNLDALEKALLSESRPVVLLAGGKDKGFGFAPLQQLVSARVREVILIGEMRERIAQDWPESTCTLATSLEEAVHLAYRKACPGDTVLFSPGTSSFDMFRNYGERGNRFKEAVASLQSPPKTNP